MRDLHPPESRPRVLIAEDHGIVADGIRALLAGACEVLGIVSDGRALLTEAPKLNPDLIVADIGMPLLNGFDAAERLKDILPATKFVFLTMQEDRNLAAAVLKLGTVGFVLKRAATAELLTAVSEVLAGKTYITPKLRPPNPLEREARARQYSKELSHRQLEVLQLLAEGHPIKETADILKVSEKTVLFHKYRIMEDHDLKSNADLVRFAIKHNVISP